MRRRASEAVCASPAGCMCTRSTPASCQGASIVASLRIAQSYGHHVHDDALGDDPACGRERVASLLRGAHPRTVGAVSARYDAGADGASSRETAYSAASEPRSTGMT